MENREQQILSEIKAMVDAIRAQLEVLDTKMAELQQCVDPEDFDSNPIELDIDEMEPVVDDHPSDDTNEAPMEPVIDVPLEPEEEVLPEPVVEAIAEQEVEELPEPEVELPHYDEDDDDLPGVFDQPTPLYAAAQAMPKTKPSVVEVMAETHPWRNDMPGSPVKDVRSAISLNDRIIFINYLFDEDPMAFQNAIMQINGMTTLDQVVEYLKIERPQWDFNSELVYRFMMAVRRRVK